MPSLTRRTRLALAFCAISLWGLAPCPAHADNWQATLYNEGLPSHLVAVDKKRQTFLFFEKKSPLKLKYAFPCVTGQLAGDKQELNDLKTPEGIYFVEYKIASGLDFREYGGIAYTLNYPNPVDRLRGKTGHGIWIHSKGFGLVPTRGCVAIGLEDIGTVGPSLTPGTAVVLAERMDESKAPQKDTGTARELRRLMNAWSNTWAARSKKLFDFYDADAYTKATENFSAFRSNKERLFGMLKFIKIYNREIHVLEGPGYWVTWAEQYYTASNLSTEGVRRLYWQRGKDRKLRIVGMEWIPRDVGMQADFKKGRLVAQTTVPVATDASEAPVPPRLDMPESPDDAPAGVNAGKPLQVAVSEPLVPRTPPSPPPAVINWGNDAAREQEDTPGPDINQQAIGGTQGAPADSGQQAGATGTQNKPDMERQDAQPATPADDELTPELQKTIAGAATAFNEALAARSAEIFKNFDEKQFNKVKGMPRGLSYGHARRDLQRYLDAPWIVAISHAPLVVKEGPVFVSRSRQMLVTPGGVEEGTRELRWIRGEQGGIRIVGMSFRPEAHGLAADYLNKVADGISADLEAWRQAWANADIEAYMACYTEGANQQGRVGQRAIRAQKAELWSRAKPVQVRMSGIRLTMDRQGVRADMTQDFSDSLGRSDRGVKTLLLRFDGAHWRIARENWAAGMPASARQLR